MHDLFKNRIRGNVSIIWNPTSTIKGSLEAQFGDTLKSSVSPISTDTIKGSLQVGLADTLKATIIPVDVNKLRGSVSVPSKELLKGQIAIPPHSRMKTVFNIAAPPRITKVFSPVQDAYVEEDATLLNFGQEELLYVGSYGGIRYRSFLRYNITSLPQDLIITKASLQLSAIDVNVGMQNIEISEVNSPWQENSITWLGQPTRGNLAGVFNIDAGSSITDINLLSLIKKWYSNPNSNFGIVLKALDETVNNICKSFYSKEYAGGNFAPKLVIEYFDPRVWVYEDSHLHGQLDVLPTGLYSRISGQVDVKPHYGESILSGSIGVGQFIQGSIEVTHDTLWSQAKVHNIRSLPARVSVQRITPSTILGSIEPIQLYLRSQLEVRQKDIIKGQVNPLPNNKIDGQVETVFANVIPSNLRIFESNDLTSKLEVIHTNYLNSEVEIKNSAFYMWSQLNVKYANHLNANIYVNGYEESQIQGSVSILESKIKGGIQVWNKSTIQGCLQVYGNEKLKGVVDVKYSDYIKSSIYVHEYGETNIRGSIAIWESKIKGQIPVWNSCKLNSSLMVTNSSKLPGEITVLELEETAINGQVQFAYGKHIRGSINVNPVFLQGSLHVFASKESKMHVQLYAHGISATKGKIDVSHSKSLAASIDVQRKWGNVLLSSIYVDGSSTGVKAYAFIM